MWFHIGPSRPLKPSSPGPEKEVTWVALPSSLSQCPTPICPTDLTMSLRASLGTLLKHTSASKAAHPCTF